MPKVAQLPVITTATDQTYFIVVDNKLTKRLNFDSLPTSFRGYTGSIGIGVPGNVGYTGSRGVQGFTGFVGSKGDQGDQGDGGFLGSRGLTGYTGSKGTNGVTGFTGSVGTGYTGSKGFVGSKGYSGSKGNTGGVDFNVYDSGGGTYYINGQHNPSLTLARGFNYYFSIFATGCPFWIVTTPNGGPSYAYNSGVTNNGSDSGIVTFSVPYDAPDYLYYRNPNAPTMNGTFAISNIGRGYAGSKGDPGGYTGSKGFVGSRGDPGGYTGSRGNVGFSGSVGDLGFTGSRGFEGSRGTPGYVGSASTALGPQGPIGFTGSVGFGYSGSRGNPGYSGSQGDPGGYTGSIGSPGYWGSRGFSGYTGSGGLPARAGYSGSKGDRGYDGSNSSGGGGGDGYWGSVGYTGSRAYTGSMGYYGSRGYDGSNAIGGGASALDDLSDVVLTAPISNGQVLKYNGSNWVNDTDATGGGGGGGLVSRAAFTTSTSVIADSGSANGTILGYKTYVLSKVATTVPAWVRIYTDTFSRSNDSTRVVGTDPLPGSGIITEVITTSGQLTQLISPGVVGFNNDGTPSTNVYLAITNQSGSSSAVGVTITLLQLES